MKKYNINVITFSFTVAFLVLPNTISACAVGLSAAAAVVGGLLLAVVAVPLFMSGYVPYVIFSLRLAREASTPEGITRRTKILASIFVSINTLVFLSGVIFIAVFSLALFLCDLLLWGIPFYFYVKGMRTGKMAIPRP